MQQQIWGEVVDFNLAFCQFIWECNGENVIKIGPYLPMLLQETFGAVFLAHPVYCDVIIKLIGAYSIVSVQFSLLIPCRS